MSQQINLYNPQFEHQVEVFTVRSMATALGVLVLGLIGVIATAELRVARLQGEVDAGARRVAHAEKRLTEANASFAPRARDSRLEAELGDADAQHAALQRVAERIARGELGDTHGYAEYFRALARQNVEGLWLTGVSIDGAGSEIGVRGRALDAALVPGYLTRLRNEPVLQGKAIGSMVIRQAAPVKTRAADGKESEAAAPYVEFTLGTTAAGADGVQANGGQR
ncbi:PilN domain-containing protein [Massilia sp. 9096]|uniref:PilN domain-containing protein n=1 Tax=Massilia sp. 9096 TaxID=1500894 RepID=UPI00055FAAC2|nr:PilN domain-containing protein [Massilia sp. 9096]